MRYYYSFVPRFTEIWEVKTFELHKMTVYRSTLRLEKPRFWNINTLEIFVSTSNPTCQYRWDTTRLLWYFEMTFDTDFVRDVITSYLIKILIYLITVTITFSHKFLFTTVYVILLSFYTKFIYTKWKRHSYNCETLIFQKCLMTLHSEWHSIQDEQLWTHFDSSSFFRDT